MNTRWVILWLLLIGPLLSPSQLYGWNREGHELICAIAEANLTIKARQFVKNVLALGEFLDGNRKDDLASACAWPDKAKYKNYAGTYESHFLNIPQNAAEINLSRDCAALDCIAVGIQRSLVYLMQTASSERERARKAAALRFLGHFVGDLHQPLHISHREDRGGNKIKVTWFGRTSNLHKVWDVGILVKSGLGHPDNLGFFLKQEILDNENNIRRWMEASLAIARGFAYLNTSGNKIRSGDRLGQAYFERSKPIVIRQLVLAGHRLAFLINSAVNGTLDPNILIN